jgi:hypothetical protein
LWHEKEKDCDRGKQKEQSGLPLWQKLLTNANNVGARVSNTNTFYSDKEQYILRMRSAKTLLHDSDRSRVNDRLAHTQPGAAATSTQAGRIKKGQHTRQFYPTMVLVPSNRKIDAKSDWLPLVPGNASHRCPLAAASSAGAYLKRKLRAKLLILSIPRLSRGELLERKAMQL